MQVFKSIVGKPSGPAAAVLFNSEQAFSISAGPNSILVIALSSSSATLKCSWKLDTAQAGLGVAKTLSYWAFRASAEKSALGLSAPSLSRKGPTLVLVYCLLLAKEKKALGFSFILRTA